MKYDDAEIYFMHFENDDLPNEAGATHIGMFMAWAIIHNLVSEDFQEEAAEEIEKVKSREITGRDLVVDVCDCKLLDEELNEEGNEFATWYYETKYIKDYYQVFEITGDTTVKFCSVEDKWENFDKLAPVLDKRFDEWKKACA
jgi:hypothetical protein